MSMILQPPVPTYTWANKPASYATGQPIFLSNVGTKGTHWFYDGTTYKPANGQCTLATLDATSSNINNSETVVFQYQMPTALLAIGWRLLFRTTFSKSGTTDSLTWRVRVGTAGTTSDTQVGGATLLGATARQGAIHMEYRVESATTMQALPGTAGVFGYSGSTAITTALPSAVTISNISGSLFANVTVVSTSTNDTVNLLDATLTLAAPAN